MTTSPPIDIDISAHSFWEKPFEERDRSFAWLRENRPVSWNRAWESTLKPPDEDSAGYWAVTRYDDCRSVSRNSKVFSSAGGVVLEDFPEVIVVATTSFLAMDDPEHNQLRQIVGQAFTPKRVRTMEEWIQEEARDLVDRMIDLGEGDFCDLYAKMLPGRIFAHFFGLERDSAEQHIVMEAAEKMLAWDDPEAQEGRDALTTFAEEAEKIQDIALELAEKRRLHPADDMVSWVVQAEFEGRKMEDFEVAAFFSLLGSAANDTTRHSAAHAVRLFTENPDQLALLQEDWEGRIDNAVEEILRHATPVMHFCRIATEDTELGGAQIRAGDKVALWYSSGNRDEAQFPDAAKFDILRSNAKTHMSFGAGGTHFCIGAALGRFMLKAALTEVYTRMPDIKVSGDPYLQVNSFMHGVARLPVAWTPPQG